MPKINYRRIFRDICRGFSEVEFDGKSGYIKHFGSFDQVDLEDAFDKYFSSAKDRGVPTEKESLDRLIDDGQWSSEDDKKIKKERSFLESLLEQKKNLILKSKIDAKSKQIKQQRQKVSDLELEKKSLLGYTCEKYAGDRVNDFYIIRSFFKDSELNDPFFDESEFNELDVKYVSEIVLKYNLIIGEISEENVKRMVLDPFFFAYFPFIETTEGFLGKPACWLSNSQLQMMLYARVFKNIFDNNDNIPDAIRQDPDALIDYANSSEKIKEKMERSNKEGSAVTMVGATKEDIEQIKQQSGDAKTVSIREEAKKKGGTLSMADMMKIHGV